MSTRIDIAAVIVWIAFASCITRCQPKEALDGASWLMGTWEQRTSRGIVYESWAMAGNESMHGKSFTIKEGDTIVLETVRLMQRDDVLIYTPTVANQNNQQPVEFVLKSLTSNQLIFENPTHDFPQVISYRQVNADSLVAVISGSQDGEYREVQFPMSRMKQRDNP